VLIEDWYQEHGRSLAKPGAKPVLSDSEVITINDFGLFSFSCWFSIGYHRITCL
jgi:hypothetical protein